MAEDKEEEESAGGEYSPISRALTSNIHFYKFILKGYNLHFIFVLKPKVTMFNAKERSDIRWENEEIKNSIF